ncbi:MAG TPA: sensor histidine kinase [Marmoricola sp.]|nr:sensor histidine kinase [Marmoricola sp.]
MPRRPRLLATGILINQLVILTITVLIGFALFAYRERADLDHQYEQRAATIAQTAAATPVVVKCLEAPANCGPEVQTVATRIMHSSGASYVVVIDRNRIRHSHPIATLIGQRVEEPVYALDGRTHTRSDHGKTGWSANALAPVFAPNGQVLGEVSAGLLESGVTAELWHELPTYAVWFAVALAFGAIASFLLATRLKRRTFGLELEEIAELLQEREATLHGIKEGVIGLRPDGRVSTINDEARRLLGVGFVGPKATLNDLAPAGRLHDVLSGEINGPDEVVLTDEFCLVVNRMPVTLAGRAHGAVITLRDRTEMSGLLRELDSVQRLTDALRAQHHDFANHLHTVAGLIELGENDEALRYLVELGAADASFSESLRARISSPLIVGLLVGKAAVASERGISLVLDDDSWLGDSPERVQAVTTILGNLIDNALDALSGDRVVGDAGRIEITVLDDESDLTLRVRDNGPGIPEDLRDQIFTDGFTTKAERAGLRRGLGLALVHRLVQRLG